MDWIIHGETRDVVLLKFAIGMVIRGLLATVMAGVLWLIPPVAEFGSWQTLIAGLIGVYLTIWILHTVLDTVMWRWFGIYLGWGEPGLPRHELEDLDEE